MEFEFKGKNLAEKQWKKALHKIAAQSLINLFRLNDPFGRFALGALLP